MALFTCPECKKRISDSATACPKCGARLTPEIIAKSKKAEADLNRNAGLGCLVIVVILVLVGSFFPKDDNSDDDGVSPPDGAVSSSHWYQGGTLHNATMQEWSAATHRNKLATAADILMTLLRTDGVDVTQIDIDGQLRPAAEGLVRQMDAANKDGSADNQDVAEVAATLHVLMKNELPK